MTDQVRHAPSLPDDSSPGSPRARLRYLSTCLTGGVSGWKLWHYASGYRLEEIRAPGFFADACEMIREGDFMAVSAKDGGALLYIEDARPGAVITKPMATVVVGESDDTPLTLRAFLNLCRRLWSLDRVDVDFLSAVEWALFRDGPVRFLVGADDRTAALIWRAAIGEGAAHG